MTSWPSPGMVRRDIGVLDSTMAFVETSPEPDGSAPILLFLHGNPTSSFLWRQVLGELTGQVHAVAVDLIGMGASGKPVEDYSFACHRRYLDAFVDALDLRDVVLVGHDWGAVLGLDLARRRPEVVGAIAVCEGHLHPFERWSDMDEGSRELFSQLRTPDIGARMVVDENFFVDVVLPAGMTHELTESEWAHYRAPFVRPEDRWPILRWIQQIPIEGAPAEVVEAVLANQQTLLRGHLPRLLMVGEPGAVVGAAEVSWARAHGQDLTIATVGAGTHFLPEDCPGAIADTLRTWLSLPG